MKKVTAFLGAMGSLMMGGCATSGMEHVEKKVNQNVSDTEELMRKSAIKVPAAPLISKSKDFFVNKNPLPPQIDPAKNLPPMFKTQIAFNHNQQTLKLNDVLSRLTEEHGLMFVLSQDVYDGDAKVMSSSSPSMKSNADSTQVKTPINAGGNNKSVELVVSDLMYQGSLVGFLDVLANKTGLAWKFDGEKVHFFRYETKLFKVYAMDGSTTMTSSVSAEGKGSSGSESSGSSGGSASSTMTSSNAASLKVSNDIWKDITTSIEKQLTPGKGQMTAMGSTGYVAITDTPQQLRRIEQYIKEINKNLGRQIAFNVDIYSVELKSSDSYGIDWNSVWQTMSNKYNINVKTSNGTGSLSNSLALNLLNAKDGGVSNWNASSAVMGALSSVGKTTLMTSTSLVTLNNIAVPYSVTDQDTYLKSQSVTVSGTSGTAQTSLNPDTRSLGLGLTLDPKLTDTDMMFLRIVMNLSTDGGMTNYVTPDGKSSVMLPKTGKRDSYQTVKIRSGETIILSGFQQVKSSDNKQGVGSANNWAWSGSKTDDDKVSTLVILITPYVME